MIKVTLHRHEMRPKDIARTKIGISAGGIHLQMTRLEAWTLAQNIMLMIYKTNKEAEERKAEAKKRKGGRT
jgi:hypothetical protein